jgi:N-acylneuraminate cytidylyltransferase/CMP-N,N'-diacetyllegionaminic acid synthase
MILGIIPARAGSKGIPNKNIYPLCGKPLIQYTINPVIHTILEDIVISTDELKLLFSTNTHWLTIQARPKELALDNTPIINVVNYVVKTYEKVNKNIYIDTVCILQPTSPLRTIVDIDTAIELYRQSGADSLYSGYYMGIKHKEKTYDKHQDKPHFQRNGAIFITRRDLLEKGLLWSDNVIEFEMPKSRSIDIDDMDDMFIAESLIKNGVLK